MILRQRPLLDIEQLGCVGLIQLPKLQQHELLNLDYFISGRAQTWLENIVRYVSYPEI